MNHSYTIYTTDSKTMLREKQVAEEYVQYDFIFTKAKKWPN